MKINSKGVSLPRLILPGCPRPFAGIIVSHTKQEIVLRGLEKRPLLSRPSGAAFWPLQQIFGAWRPNPC
jgi:hypothetical protein